MLCKNFYKKFDDELKGDILIASLKSTRIIDDIQLGKDTVLIVGDRHSVIENAIKSGIKLLIMTWIDSAKPLEC